MKNIVISFFKPFIIIFYILLLGYRIKSESIRWQSKITQNILEFNITQFIHEKKRINSLAANYFIKHNITAFINNYELMKPSHASVEYHKIFPFHSDGKTKLDINYCDYFNEENVVIKHYSKYLDHEDISENDKSISKILPRKYKEDNELKIKLAMKKFILIYLLTLTISSSFLIREIKAMSHPDVAFILFIDNKSNRTKLYNIFQNIDESLYRSFYNVYFIDSPRFEIGWGRINQALSQAVLMFAGLKYFSNSMYLSFHSESDYPIVPNEVIIDYLKAHYPNNYIETISEQDQEIKSNRITNLNFFFNESEKLIDSIKYLFPNRIIPPFPWAQGSNWFTLTVADSKKIIDQMLNNFTIIDHLDYSFNVDEILFQTLVSMAKIPAKNNYHRYIDWSQGGNSPKIMDETQFEKIISDPCNFWARKFNNIKSQKVLQMIDNYIIDIRKRKKYRVCHN